MRFIHRSIGLAAALTLLAACGSIVAPINTLTSGWQPIGLSGIPAGFRGAAYDPTRDCIWILSDQLGAVGGHSLISLARFNISDGSSVGTAVAMNGDSFVKGLAALDAQGKVWLGWGQTVAQYNPDTNFVQSWALPSISNVVQPHISISDGNLVALAVASDGEIWVAAQNVQALFGFNPSKQSWDRTIQLPFLPTDTSRIAEPQAGVLGVSGAELKGL